MPAERGRRFLHRRFGSCAKPLLCGEMIDDDDLAARAQDSQDFIERARRRGQYAHHMGRERDIEPAAAKIERLGGTPKALIQLISDFGQLRQMPQQAGLQRAIAVNGNRKAYDTAGFSVDVMAARDSQQPPAAPLDQTREVAAGDPPHRAISRMRSLPVRLDSSTSTDRQPSIASCTLRSSSSMVSPCVAHPGIAGTSAQKPPSSASWTTTFIFMPLSPAPRARAPAQLLATHLLSHPNHWKLTA